MSDKPAAKCPDCGGEGQRLIGAGSGIIFKGSGFYATDYKNKKACPEAKSDACKNCSLNKDKDGGKEK
jgi:predicted nucleic acid-binding Zn ribbon protein